MYAKKLALIGHSGTGKTSCLVQLGFDLHRADMDIALGTTRSPPLADALRWLTGATDGQIIVVVSNHEQMLTAMQRAKVTGEFADSFARLCFVYLWKPKDRLARHLARPQPGGSLRPPASQRYTIDNYDRFHAMFHSMADQTIDCTSKGIAAVADDVKALSESL
jgi:hypothetical protein